MTLRRSDAGWVEAADEERYELTEPERYRFALARRHFLGLVGGGLAVAVTMPAAQESGRFGRGRESEDTLAGWLHVGSDGRVTAYTGKVEIGQNIRTSLAQAVADELRLPVDAVSLVMGDTALTPFDAGTFGSRTTPTMAPQLARAAAVAREQLIDRAASQWHLDRSQLTVRGGRVTEPGGRALGFGALVADTPLSGAVSSEAALRPPPEWQTRGRALHKVNAEDIVTGRHRYPSDVTRPAMLHGCIVRPETPGAALEAFEAGSAEGMTGVTVVRDGDFVGVVAPTASRASVAAASVKARWRSTAAAVSSQSVYEHFRRTALADVKGRRAVVEGDVEQAFADAAQTIEASYTIPYIAHVPLEPRAAVAEWVQGDLTIWTGTQRPFGVRSQLAEAFHLPESRVRVIVPDTGSAYGGKHTGEHAIEAARLARAVGRPVKLVWTRTEEFTFGYLRPAGLIAVKAGVTAAGKLLAWQFDNWNSGRSSIRTPYAVPHQRITFHRADSPLRQGSYRGLAATANHYAREMHMDAVARAIGVDAVKFRLAHLEEPRMVAALEAAADRIGWEAPAGESSLGIACGTEKGSYVATAARLSRHDGGFRVDRLVVAFECGAIVNPDGLRHQVEGSVVQGLGGALFEAIAFENSRLLNGTFGEYRVPRFEDVPPIDVILLDRPDLPSAGAGETPIVCVAPAIGTAAKAFGHVAPALPISLTPDR
jgi:CO/xanthine dehydrogenase Mo-binding subunit